MKPFSCGSIFKIITTIIVIVLLSATFFCSKKGDRGQEQNQFKVKKARSPKPVITSVELDPPAPISTDFIRVAPQLEDPGMPHMKFQYQWFVNGKEITEVKKKLLDKKFYKKGDRVFCRVSATRGTFESKTVKSKVVTIGNSSPEVNVKPIGSFTVPGRFQYTIQAHDPDGDPLTYHLVAPLDVGIQLNPETGEIIWDIPEIPEETTTHTPIKAEEEGQGKTTPRPQTSQPPENRLSPIVNIAFEVRDPDDGVGRGVITLNLTKGKEVPQ